MSFAVISVFEFANREIGTQGYAVHLLSKTGGSIRASSGVSVAAEPFDDTNFDTLIVGPPPGLVKFVQQALGRYRRVAATCAGALVHSRPKILVGTSGAWMF
jgi:transcriptional regulator GlxA family with amidase domain